jgi:hypothetical protein
MTGSGTCSATSATSATGSVTKSFALLGWDEEDMRTIN